MNTKAHFTTVIQENEGLIYKVTSIYTKSMEDRNDLYQEIVYQLWKSFPSFQGKSKISTWIYRVALNTSIFYLKKNKRKIATIAIDMEVMRFQETNDPTELRRIETLYEHIQQLNLLEKGIILLYLEGNSHEEIAEITGLSKTNIGTRLSRIKEKLKAQINKNE